MREWLGCWLGACVALFFAIWIAATIQKWGSILSFSHFLIVLGLKSATVASITEAGLLAFDSVRRGRKVGRYVYVILGVVGSSVFALVLIRDQTRDRDKLERHRASALSQCSPERVATRSK